MTATTTDRDDEALLSEFRTTGGRGAMGELVRRHVDFVYSAARRQVGDGHLAEDVTQAVFVLLGRKRPSVGAGKLAGWLFNTTRFVAKNAIKMEMRRRKHERAAAAERPEGGAASGPSDWAAEVGPVLDQAVAKLGGRERDVVLMHYFQNLTLAEVARRLGISEVAARQRSSRAVGKLREMLAKDGVTCSAAGLVSGMREQGVVKAPEGVAAKAAAGGSGGGVALAGAASAAAVAIKVKVAALVLGAAVAVGTGVVLVEQRAGRTSAGATAGAIAAPDLSGVKTFRTNVTLRQPGMATYEGEVRIDFSKGVVERVRAAGDTYVTWFDGTETYAYREGGNVVVRWTHGKFMSFPEARGFLSRFGTWVQASPKRDAGADVVAADGTKLAAYQVSRWVVTKNQPSMVWVDSAGRPVRARGASHAGAPMEYEAAWDRAVELPAGLPAGVRVVTDDQLAGEEFPVAGALFTGDAASHVVVVHSARRDSRGFYHVLTSATINEAGRAVVGVGTPVNYYGHAEGARVVPVTRQEIGGVASQEFVVAPAAGGGKDGGVCEFDVTVMPWGDVSRVLQEARRPIGGIVHVKVRAEQGGTFEEECGRTYDRVAREAGAVSGGVVTEVQGTVTNSVPAAVVGREGFIERVGKRVGG